jgi:serine/threonine protein kinase
MLVRGGSPSRTRQVVWSLVPSDGSPWEIAVSNARDSEPLARELQELRWIDEVVDRFDQAWNGGAAPPAITDYLGDAAGPRRRDLLCELILVDIEYRTKRGCPKTAQQYASEFPELAQPDGSLEPNIAAFEQLVRQRAPTDAKDLLPASVAQDAVLPPECIAGKYRIVARLGAGGQAEVYRALDTSLSRDVIIKLSRRSVTPELEGATNALLSEGRILAALEHVNLARVYDCGLHELRPYLVMEYVRGANLAQYKQFHTVTPRDAARLVTQIARALATVHAHNTLHLDLKPKNIMIDEAGHPRLIDFGLAHLREFWSDDARQFGGGTPAYLSPEQARCEEERIGPASDVFGAGAVLYFLLTGAAPFAADSPLESLDKAAVNRFDREALTRACVPRRLRDICLRALADDPADRYPTAAALAAALEQYTGHRRRIAAAGLIVTVALAALLAIVLSNRREAEPPFGPPRLPDDTQQENLEGQLLVESVERQEAGKVQPHFPTRWNDILGFTPLKGGDLLKFSWKLSAEYRVAAFWVDTQGRVQELPTRQHPAEGDVVRYTCPATNAWKLSDVHGTALFLVCANRGRKPDMAAVQRAVSELHAATEALPALPANVVLKLRKNEVEPYGEVPRDGFGTSPYTQVKDRLEELRAKLARTCEVFHGVALPQE